MRLIIEAMPGRCIVAGRLTEDDPGMNLCTLSGELRYRDGSQRSARLRLLYREGQQLPAIGEYVLARVLPGEIMLEFLQENYIKPDVLYASARDVRPFGESYHFRSGEGREEEHIFSGRIDVQSMTAVTRKGGTAVSFRLQNGPASLTARGKRINALFQTEEGVFVTGPMDRNGEYTIKRIRKKQ